jgi:uncharacterized repeat protein (TIGR02543 family)
MSRIEVSGSLSEATVPGGFFRAGTLVLLSICLFVASFAAGARAAIPDGERTVLLSLYTATNGSGWTNSTNWNGPPGTECTWYGVSCNSLKTHVTAIALNNNNLSGTLPGLGGLNYLQSFTAFSNQLTGRIPPFTGLNLQYFSVENNRLTGTIPPLNCLINLQYFAVGWNQLTGPIPSLSGLTNLEVFSVDNNQLTRPIPSLSGLINLQVFDAGQNYLTGPIPSLSGLANLMAFLVANNQLTGDVPAVPSPNNLVLGMSGLCPNNLNAASDPAWDAATGSTPWYQSCIPPATYGVTYSGNDNTGGSVPVDSGAYTSGQMVTVLGNTGALYNTGYCFAGWNTSADGCGTSYAGGNTFSMGLADVMLYAQWTPASAFPVRIVETLLDYPDIQYAYDAAQAGQTIEAQAGLGSQNGLIFDNRVSVKLRGGYDTTFTNNTGATLVSGGIEIDRGIIEIENIIIQ